MLWIRLSITTKHHESRKNKDIPPTSDLASCEITTVQISLNQKLRVFFTLYTFSQPLVTTLSTLSS